MGPNDKVGMIIGTNCPRGIYIVDIIHGPPNLPQAIQFVLGWTLQGLVPHKEETPYGRDFPPPDHSALNYGRDFPLSTVKEEPNSAVCQRVVAYGRDFPLNKSKVPGLAVDNSKVFGCSYRKATDWRDFWLSTAPSGQHENDWRDFSLRSENSKFS